MFILMNLLFLSFLSGCSTHGPHPKERKLASKDYECKFTETIAGEKVDFVFIPDALKLMVTNSKSGLETIYLEEDNFVSGGFTYTQAKGKEVDWLLSKIEFISYTASPKVTVDFKRTPASKAVSISKSCTL